MQISFSRSILIAGALVSVVAFGPIGAAGLLAALSIPWYFSQYPNMGWIRYVIGTVMLMTMGLPICIVAGIIWAGCRMIPVKLNVARSTEVYYDDKVIEGEWTEVRSI